MKRVSFIFFPLLLVSSCLKNDDSTSSTSTVSYRNPTLERKTIDSFTNAMGLTNMVYDSNLEAFKYEIISLGDTTKLITASTPYGYLKYYGKTMKGITFDSSFAYTDSIKEIDLYNSAVLGKLPTCWWYVFINRAVPAKIGLGGHIRFVTPSKYAYMDQSIGIIAANSPLFYDIELRKISDR